MKRTRDAIASTVACAGGTLEMDGYRPVEFEMQSDTGTQASRQMRITDSEDNVVELALTLNDVRNVIDVLELYR